MKKHRAAPASIEAVLDAYGITVTEFKRMMKFCKEQGFVRHEIRDKRTARKKK